MRLGLTPVWLGKLTDSIRLATIETQPGDKLVRLASALAAHAYGRDAAPRAGREVMTAIKIVPWSGEQLPTEAALQHILHSEGLTAYRWSNGPGDRYEAHTHAYHKVLYVVSGSITFGLPDEGQHLTIAAGDRLELPAGVRHDALVGPDGVVCLEAHST